MTILNLSENRFSALPCSIHKMELLEEFSLEWFNYAKPPI